MLQTAVRTSGTYDLLSYYYLLSKKNVDESHIGVEFESEWLEWKEQVTENLKDDMCIKRMVDRRDDCW